MGAWNRDTTCLLLQEKKTHRTSRELSHGAFKEQTTELQSGGTLIEVDCRRQVWDVDVH
jgi:hypothetical protein